MDQNKWEGTAEELKSLVTEGLIDENSAEFDELAAMGDVGALSCETTIVGTCERAGKIGSKIKYTCHYPNGKEYSFHVCDIN